MISAYATEARLVLAQEKVDEKSNEITAIPSLLDWLDLRGNIVTIDAMGCQWEIANKIVNRNGNYIFSLKGNQGNLQDDVKTYLEDKMVIEALQPFTHNDKGHGRIETRTCWTSQDVAWLHERHERWKTIKSIIRIDCLREIKGTSSKETRYYVSSLVSPPDKILSIRRQLTLVRQDKPGIFSG